MKVDLRVLCVRVKESTRHEPQWCLDTFFCLFFWITELC